MAIERVDLSIKNGDFPYSFVSGIISIQPDWWWTDVLNSTRCFLVMDRGVRFSARHGAISPGQHILALRCWLWPDGNSQGTSVGSRKMGTLGTMNKPRGCTGVPDLQTSVLLL